MSATSTPWKNQSAIKNIYVDNLLFLTIYNVFSEYIDGIKF